MWGLRQHCALQITENYSVRVWSEPPHMCRCALPPRMTLNDGCIPVALVPKPIDTAKAFSPVVASF